MTPFGGPGRVFGTRGEGSTTGETGRVTGRSGSTSPGRRRIDEGAIDPYSAFVLDRVAEPALLPGRETGLRPGAGLERLLGS